GAAVPGESELAITDHSVNPDAVKKSSIETLSHSQCRAAVSSIRRALIKKPCRGDIARPHECITACEQRSNLLGWERQRRPRFVGGHRGRNGLTPGFGRDWCGGRIGGGAVSAKAGAAVGSAGGVVSTEAGAAVGSAGGAVSDEAGAA